jgi:methylisocitrate lyase
MAEQPSARRRLREALAGDGPVLAPLCLDPLTARLLTELGFSAGYVSGGALGFQYAVSEALLTAGDVADVTRRITRRSDLAVVADGGVGFGDPVHVARAVWELEEAGAAAIEIEDQVAPKRVHHHVGVEHLVDTATMAAKIEVAVAERRDPDLAIIARTGAVRHEGLDAAIDRLTAYRAAGADVLMLFCSTEQLATVAGRVEGPFATITTLDRHPRGEWASTGWSLVIDAFAGQAVPLQALRDAYRRYLDDGSLGVDLAGMDLHRELVGLCGLEPLLDVERRTTERGDDT